MLHREVTVWERVRSPYRGALEKCVRAGLGAPRSSLTAILYLTGSMGPLQVGGVRITCQRGILGRGRIVCLLGVRVGRPLARVPI